jgi:hypothetical protein
MSIIYCPLCKSKKEIPTYLWEEIDEIQIIHKRHTLK